MDKWKYLSIIFMVFTGGFVTGTRIEEMQQAKNQETINILRTTVQDFCAKEYDGAGCQIGLKTLGEHVLQVGGSNG